MDLPSHYGATVLLVDGAGRVLLQQRDDDIPPAGYGRWTVPGGHAEPGETPIETARREFQEETGIFLERLHPFCVVSRDPGGDVHVFCANDPVDESAIEVNEGLAFTFWSPAASRQRPMNPPSRDLLERFFADSRYAALVRHGARRETVTVIALNRWGHVLLRQPPGADRWVLPASPLQPGESPDAAALRTFDEATTVVLEDLRLFRGYRQEAPNALLEHVYYDDPDLPLAEPGLAHFSPAALAELHIEANARTILDEFLVSPAYRALFH